MVQLNQNYVTEDVKTKPMGANVHVPDGDYQAVILDSFLDKSPFDGKPDDLVLKVVITQGEHANTELEHRLGIADDTPINESKPTFTWAVAGLGNLGQIADALNIPNFNDTALFHNKPIMITTMTSKGMDKNVTPPIHKPEWDKSRIKSYFAVPSVGASGQAPAFNPTPVSQPVSQQPSPVVQAQPASGAPQPVAQPTSNPWNANA